MQWIRRAALPLALSALVAGCAQTPGGGPKGAQADVERLRAERDRQFAEMEGKRAEPKPGGTPAVAEPAPERSPKETKEEPRPTSLPESKPRPDWVGAGFAAAYPASRYIIGVGSCKRAGGADYDAIATADDRARSELAKTIRVRIKSEFESAAKLVTEARSGAVKTKQDTSSVTNQITSQTDLVLEGAQIADRWYDAKADTCWAFAALDRAAAGATILERMNRLLQEMEKDRDLGAGFRKEGRAFQAASYFNRALKDSFGLLNYRAQLRIISPSQAEAAPSANDAAMPSLWRDAALAAEDLRVAVVVFVQADGRRAPPGAVEAELARSLRGLGLNVVQGSADEKVTYAELRNRPANDLRQYVGGRANCLLLADFAAKEVTAQKLVELVIYFYRARADAALLDLDTGREVASAGFDWSADTQTGKSVPAQAADESLLKAAQEMAKLLKAELVASLNLTE